VREGTVEEVRIDVRDLDYEWFRDVRAFIDREFDRYYFPRESVERLGEIDDETDVFYLIDGRVEARADEIDVDGQRLPVWSIGCGDLIVRPAATDRGR
jgi:hypothetical protein